MTLARILTYRTFATHAKSSFYVTTPIFYVNAAPHIGHLYSAVIADAIKRYQQIQNPSVPTYLATGTDEHGNKVQQAANNHKTPVSSYCDNISNCYKEVFKLANISNDTFIRTTESRHEEAVNHFWSKLQDKGHIYKAQYSGWYCISDETFLTESQLKESPDGSKVSVESGHPVEWSEEENYMFPMSKFQDKVVNWIEKGTKVKPKKFEKILLDYLKEPLPDISISRPSSRVSWAIPVPGDKTQTVYVWLDALVNYFSAIGYPKDREGFESKWPASVQVLGKDILKFHGIYWPAFLMACDMEPPQQLLVHSHWTVDGQKMSKSKFNVVDPMDVCDTYTMEGLRYFLLREGVAHNDGNYSSTKAVRILNSELADTFGNLLSRGCAKSLNTNQTFPRIHQHHYNELCKLEATKRLISLVEQLPEKSQQHYEDYNFYLVVDQVIATLHAANNFFETCRPWELKKASKGSEDFYKLQTITAITLDTLRVSAILLQPILPTMTTKLLDKLNVKSGERSFDCSRENFTNALRDKETNLTNENAVLFRRILFDSDENKVASKRC